MSVLDTYYAKLTTDVFQRDNFYLQPILKLPTDPAKPWFTMSPIGRNMLARMVKEICKDGNISGNNSL